MERDAMWIARNIHAYISSICHTIFSINLVYNKIDIITVGYVWTPFV